VEGLWNWKISEVGVKERRKERKEERKEVPLFLLRPAMLKYPAQANF
jgi:hypothetical protein